MLEKLTCFGIPVDWLTVAVGWESGLLNADEVVDFAAQYWSRHPDDAPKAVMGLASADASDSEAIAKSLGSLTRPEDKSFGLRRWRYYYVNEALVQNAGKPDVGGEVQEVFDDFVSKFDLAPNLLPPGVQPYSWDDDQYLARVKKWLRTELRVITRGVST